MPTLYIHVGLHKTGTTSLQKTLHDNRPALREQGILYPETGLSEKAANWGHHELAYALRHRGKARQFWTAMREEADAKALPKVMISSEEFALLPFPTMPGAEPFKLIAEIFASYEIQLICYLRPQAEMIESLYNHNVKSVGEQRGILDFMAQIAPRLEYQHYLNVAALGLGPQAIIVRRYQKAHMKNGDIVSDIAELIGLDRGPLSLKTAELNPGLTARGMAEMLEANRRHADNPMRLQAARSRILAKHRAPAFYRHELLSPETRQVIEALYRAKNRQISRRFLKRDEDLFPVDPQPETATAS
ncbi:hypothetical protein [Salipiger sp. PrR002]|uniref:hypothetical protein n=1 Tax=Salipiger sp. PrR002 TaxID=2706489 RepID=UPI0013B5BE8F|nr:hypothetical protein [Salipiger sp. PrR002]NDW01330.1 hypothetical protein [Salipiger sp. PrR002]NDW58881.1 hypothetical protein [Salipiger sp. PrR004]